MITKRKSIQTITDPLLEPFFITKDEYSYAVKEIIKSDADHFRSKGKGKEYEKSLYYYPKFGQAISKIAELKADMNAGKIGKEAFTEAVSEIKAYVNPEQLVK